MTTRTGLAPPEFLISVRDAGATATETRDDRDVAVAASELPSRPVPPNTASGSAIFATAVAGDALLP